MICGMIILLCVLKSCFSIDLYGEQSGVKVEIGDDQQTEVCGEI